MASVGLLIIWKVISLIELETFYSFWKILNVKNLKNFQYWLSFNPITQGGVFRTRSNYAAFGDSLTVKYIEMFHADISYLSIHW